MGIIFPLMNSKIRVICITQSSSFERQLNIMRQINSFNAKRNGIELKLYFCDENTIKEVISSKSLVYDQSKWSHHLDQSKELFLANY